MKNLRIILITFLVIISSIGSYTFAENSSSEVLSSEQKLIQEFNENKQSVQNQIDRLKKDLDVIATQYSNNSSQNSSLNQSLEEKRKLIQETNTKITDTRLVVGQINKQVEDHQIAIDKKIEELQDIVLEIQKRNQEPFLKTLLASDNLGEFLGEIFSLSNSQDNLEVEIETINQLQNQLLEVRTQNEIVQSQLEQTRALLKSQESSIATTIQETENQEIQYRSLLEAITEQKNTLEAQLTGLDGEYIAELQDLREEEIAYNESGTDCTFEETTSLRVTKEYFVPPTQGWLTQDFHCGHDGIDIANELGTPIVSIADGIVVRIGPDATGCIGIDCNGGFGNYILVKHSLPSGQVVYSLYAHLNRVSPVSVNQKVARGQFLGEMGCTGYTRPYPCGVHLHFVMLSQNYETYGLGCRLGSATCYYPKKYINFIS